MKIVILIAFLSIFLLSPSVLISSPVVGDTQGKVKSVNIKPVVDGKHSLQIRFSSIENDRWGVSFWTRVC
jgi:hypothetical protein